MSKQYIPRVPFTVPAQLMKKSTVKVNGVNQTSYSTSQTFFCSAVSYGGTESNVNGVYAVIDTMTFETWYSPDFDSGDRIKLLDDNSEYDILATPENISRRNQYMKFRGERVHG